MKILVAFPIFIAFLSQTLTKVARINQYVEEAQVAYTHKDFSSAVYLYKYLNDSLRIRDREIQLNLAHAYFLQNKTALAEKNYKPLLTKTSPRISSVINLQLGVLVAIEDKEQALNYFKKSLILNPLNEEARYNYELLKKYLQEHPEDQEKIPPPAPEQTRSKNPKPNDNAHNGQKEDSNGSDQAEMPDYNNSDPDNQPRPNSSNNYSEGKNSNSESREEPGDEAKTRQQQNAFTGTLSGTQRGISEDNNKQLNRKPLPGTREESHNQDNANQTTFDQLEEAGITPEKAKVILETMREAEIQYLQQIPRKTTQKNKGKHPTW